MQQNVVVIGGSGQAGKIHSQNLLKLGANVAVYDLSENPNVKTNFNPMILSYSDCVRQGFLMAIVALPDHMLFHHSDQILDAGFVRIMIEKPGSMKSEELQKLITKAQNKNIQVFINYQRSFDDRISDLLLNINDKIQNGFQLDYASVYSCDKAQPPQASPQYLNQGCHDYALLLSIFEASGMRLKDLNSKAINWKGYDDTKFFKVTGTATNEVSEALFDVQMGRVNANGTFTELYVKLSKYVNGTYEPFEQKLIFPETPNLNAHWSDVWGQAFFKSAEAFLIGQNGVPLVFGLNILKFAEMAGLSLSNKSEIIVS